MQDLQSIMEIPASKVNNFYPLHLPCVPASLLRFQPLESSSLYDFSGRRGQKCVLEDGVTVLKDGLVYSSLGL